MAGRLSESEVAVLELEIPESHGESALFGVEEPVDFRLADWLLKGNAGEHFEGRRREIKISARPRLCFWAFDRRASAVDLFRKISSPKTSAGARFRL